MKRLRSKPKPVAVDPYLAPITLTITATPTLLVHALSGPSEIEHFGAQLRTDTEHGVLRALLSGLGMLTPERIRRVLKVQQQMEAIDECDDAAPQTGRESSELDTDEYGPVLQVTVAIDNEAMEEIVDVIGNGASLGLKPLLAPLQHLDISWRLLPSDHSVLTRLRQWANTTFAPGCYGT